jgi:hypothetical protein
VSNLWAETYDYAIAPTLSDSADEPGGPFAGLYCSVAGNVQLLQQNGPNSTITVAMAAGTYWRTPVRRVCLSSTTATVLGLRSRITPPAMAGTTI